MSAIIVVVLKDKANLNHKKCLHQAISSYATRQEVLLNFMGLFQVCAFQCDVCIVYFYCNSKFFQN